VIAAICPSSLKVLRGESTLPSSSRTVIKLRNPTLCPTSSAPRVVKVMSPKPPTCMSTMTTMLPKCVNVCENSTEESPVTLAALTETKRASTQEIPP